MANTRTRQSNFELIRIVAMLFIVLWHVVIHGTQNNMEGGLYIKAVTGVGVSLYVLLSGYFNIRLTCRSFLNLFSVVLFYSLLGFLVAVVFLIDRFLGVMC